MTTHDAVDRSAPPAPPRLMAEHEGDVCDAVHDARARGTVLRIAGAGSWLDAGRPVAADATLDCSRLTGIVAYVPGDLTLTARAGTSLAELDDAVRARGQWLPLDPFGAPNGTLGATLATASAGPLAATIGLPRDVALGIAFVTGEGRLVRGGGRVVKNVAGFDLVRLAIGAWGTLGVIVEATVRLRARPAADLTVALDLPDESGALAATLRELRAAPVIPLATELLAPTLAARLGAGTGPVALVRLAGNVDAVQSQRGALARLGTTREVANDVWHRLRASDPAASAVFRLSSRPSQLARLWEIALQLTGAVDGDAHASLDRGIVRCRLGATSDAALRAALERLAPSDGRVFERLPAAWWDTIAPDVPNDPLHHALRDAFDPARVLNRGILGAESTRAASGGAERTSA